MKTVSLQKQRLLVEQEKCAFPIFRCVMAKSTAQMPVMKLTATVSHACFCEVLYCVHEFCSLGGVTQKIILLYVNTYHRKYNGCVCIKLREFYSHCAMKLCYKYSLCLLFDYS